MRVPAGWGPDPAQAGARVPIMCHMRTIGFHSNILFAIAAAFGVIAALDQSVVRALAGARKDQAVGELPTQMEDFFNSHRPRVLRPRPDVRVGGAQDRSTRVARGSRDRDRRAARALDRPGAAGARRRARALDERSPRSASSLVTLAWTRTARRERRNGCSSPPRSAWRLEAPPVAIGPVARACVGVAAAVLVAGRATARRARRSRRTGARARGQRRSTPRRPCAAEHGAPVATGRRCSGRRAASGS